MRIARIARPGSIYDVSAAAQTCPVGKTIDILEEKEDFPENEENATPERKKDFEHILGFQNFTGQSSGC